MKQCNRKCKLKLTYKLVIFQLKAILYSCRIIWGLIYILHDRVLGLDPDFENHWNARQWLNLSPVVFSRSSDWGNLGFGCISVLVSSLQCSLLSLCLHTMYATCTRSIFNVWPWSLGPNDRGSCVWTLLLILSLTVVQTCLLDCTSIYWKLNTIRIHVLLSVTSTS